MTTRMFSIYDIKTEIYHPPLFSLTVGAALRTFVGVFNSDDFEFGRFPDDFRIFELGTFDDVTGLLSPVSTPTFVAEGRELVSVAAPASVAGATDGGMKHV